MTNLKDTSIYVYTSEVTTQYHLISLYMSMYVYIYTYIMLTQNRRFLPTKHTGLCLSHPLTNTLYVRSAPKWPGPRCSSCTTSCTSRPRRLGVTLQLLPSGIHGNFMDFVLDFIGCYDVMMLRSTKKNLRLSDNVKLIQKCQIITDQWLGHLKKKQRGSICLIYLGQNNHGYNRNLQTLKPQLIGCICITIYIHKYIYIYIYKHAHMYT